MEPHITDHGSYLEILTGASQLRSGDLLEVLERASARFGLKPILVVCDDPDSAVSLDDAYRLGIDIGTRLPLSRVAIALRGRRTSEADRFIELVAANRGASVRYFESVPAAHGWLVAR